MRKTAIRGTCWVITVLLCTSVPRAETEGEGLALPLPNPGFEEGADGAVDGFMVESFAAARGPALSGVPRGWHAYQWGSPSESRFTVATEGGVSHSGKASARLENHVSTAKGGVYTHLPLPAGTYELSLWARAPEGESGRIAVYLATAYSRSFRISDQWTRVVFKNTLTEPVERAEINIQNAGGTVGIVWADDVQLRTAIPVLYDQMPDTRAERPRTLLFSPMNITYLHDTAEHWAASGFRGFLFDGVMASWPSDVWATDGDAASRDETDVLLQELRRCNAECRRHGIDSNVIKVAFYDELPDWFDDKAWQTLTENFRQGARFASMSGCIGIAIDTEYIAQQYSPDWSGYEGLQHDTAALKACVRTRWRGVIGAMLEAFPDMVLLTLPAGMLHYGDLYTDLFAGMLQACTEVDAPGGLHVMTESTYHVTDLEVLEDFPERVDSFIREQCSASMFDYWQRRGSVAMGVWPLGYYRAIVGEDGTFVGYSGRAETFGDQIVGSYADKSSWYEASVFRRQMAGVNTFCPRFNWVYGHGCVFWQWSEEQLQTYQKGVHRSIGNATVPTVPNVEDYLSVIATPEKVVRRSPKDVTPGAP